MKTKNIILLLTISLIVGLFVVSTVMAQADEAVVDPEIPESWYEAPELASEVGINEFNQAPMLNKRVEIGELPPVQERLPNDPPILEPYNEIGEYGGTVTTWDRQLGYFEYNNFNQNLATRKTPDASEAVPYYIKDYEYSDDYKEFTIYLREGVKWSDGEPFTAEDYLYWWEYYANNEVLSPTPPEKWDPPILEVTSKDKWTVTFHYGIINQFAHWLDFSINLGAWEIGPAHYMKQFHPDFVGEEKVQEMASSVGLDRWEEYYERIQADSPTHPEYEYQRPVLSPYVAIERTETSLIAERNPYYPFIDPEGNQLPYINKIRVNLVQNEEFANTKAITGESTIASRHTQMKDIPLYKRNEEKENYTTLIYRKAYATDVGIMPNLNHENLKLRAIFQDLRFRKAISLAIDRQDINNKIYYGHGIPMQNSIVPNSKYYKEEYGKAFAEYDPEKAKALLDEMGIVDRNGDGYREMPEGSMETLEGEEVNFEGDKLNVTFIYCKAGPVDPTPILELVVKKWDEIGLDVDLKMQSRELINQRHVAGDFDITFWTVATSPWKFLNLWHLGKYYAPTYGQSGHTQWPRWCNWYATDGETGVEPPEIAKELNKYAHRMLETTDESERAEMAEKILEAQAENIWNIGTVGMGPQPIIINNKLKNIPVAGLWDSDTHYLNLFRPEQFYLEE